MFRDQIVDEVRQIRDALASKFDYDIDKIVADARKRQGSGGHKVVSFAPDTASPAPTGERLNDPETRSQPSLNTN
jgi:hypothetical protein